VHILLVLAVPAAGETAVVVVVVPDTATPN
jgi:hypothetical protein